MQRACEILSKADFDYVHIGRCRQIGPDGDEADGVRLAMMT